MKLKEDIKHFAKHLGFDAIGFTSAEPFLEEKDILEDKKEKGLLSPFEEQDIEMRCYPEKLMLGARTIICFSMGYLINPYEPEETGSEGSEPIIPPVFCGKISRYAMVKDYHNVMMEKLEAIAEFILRRRPGQVKIFVDTGGLMDKACAKRAGIGWIGENTCLFTPELGSWVFLGEILTDIDIEPDEPGKDYCDHCGKCVKACPTGALIAPYQIDPHRCLSYITQMRGTIPEEFRAPLGNRIFGCDTCQEACPKNKSVKIPNHQEFVLGLPITTDLFKLAFLNKRDFERIFRPTASGWRGRNILRRNAICALGNIVRHTDRHDEGIIGKDLMKNHERKVYERGIVSFLLRLVNDPSETVREQARWSLKQISGEQV